ncbi:TPA: hypothetical protein ACHVES_001297 [Streptococcus suis]
MNLNFYKDIFQEYKNQDLSETEKNEIIRERSQYILDEQYRCDKDNKIIKNRDDFFEKYFVEPLEIPFEKPKDWYTTFHNWRYKYPIPQVYLTALKQMDVTKEVYADYLWEKYPVRIAEATRKVPIYQALHIGEIIVKNDLESVIHEAIVINKNRQGRYFEQYMEDFRKSINMAIDHAIWEYNGQDVIAIESDRAFSVLLDKKNSRLYLKRKWYTKGISRESILRNLRKNGI